MLEDPLMVDEHQSKTNGLANWLNRLDGRVTRLEEKSTHHGDGLARLDRTIERLTDALMQRMSVIDAKMDTQGKILGEKLDSGRSWLIGFLATSLLTLLALGAKVVFDAIGHK